MERGGEVVREGVETAFDEHAYAFGCQQAQEACPGEGPGGDEGVNLKGPVTCVSREGPVRARVMRSRTSSMINACE